ncbi:MAG TPA: PEPxxWA-CTERM sorting domain-containing protein [Phenylobacterium sp.]
MAALLAASGLASSAAAGPATVPDAMGDFLGTFSGPHNGDLDVLSVSAIQNGTDVAFSATLAGPVGTTPGSVYVLGVNRGAGAPLLTLGTPSVGAGIDFDAVALLFPNDTGAVVLFTGGVAGAAVPLAAGAVTVSGSTITGVIPFSMLPSTGFTSANYLYNLWPRDGLATNDQISDFAPDASSFRANVPEPATWAMMLLGFGALGAVLRRRRGELAPA